MKTNPLHVLFLILFLFACQSFSVKDASDGVILAKATLTGVNNTITTLVTNKQITKDKAKSLAVEADKAESQIKTADVLLSQGLPGDALSALKAANAILVKLQLELEKSR